MQRLCTVVSGTHCYPVPIQDLGDIVWMDPCKGKGGHTALMICGWTVDLDTGNFLQALEGIFGDLMFMSGDVLHADRIEIVDCGAEANRFRNGRSAGLKLVGKRVWTERTQLYFLDHVASTQKRRHILKQFSL